MSNNINYKKIYAIQQKNKRTILKYCPKAKDLSGIYILTREQDGFRYGYIGQAKQVLTRLAQHLSSYQHIDLSVKKHKFYSLDNPHGYKIQVKYYPEERLNELEQHYILKYANLGYQLRNKTAGGQGEGSFAIAEQKQARGYHDGLKQGYENARRDVAKWFERLEVTYDNTKVIPTRYYERFINFIKGDKEWTK